MKRCSGSREKAISQVGSRCQRVLGKEHLLDEGAVGLKNLHAVALSVADVEQIVIRQRDAVQRAAVLLSRRPIRIVWTVRGVSSGFFP